MSEEEIKKTINGCQCNQKEKLFLPDCPLTNKLNIPQEYQSAYQELFHIFSQPEIVKLIVTDRILGKTTNKALELLTKIALAIHNNEPLPQFIWLSRDFNDSTRKVMDFFRKLIASFCNNYWKDPTTDLKEKKFDTIYRGVFYNERQVIYFFDLYAPEDTRGGISGNIEEIVFDEFLPISLDKYQPEEEVRFSELLGGAYRTNQEQPTKITCLGNPYDRFNYALKNWSEELEKWAKWYQKESPSEFTIKETKQFREGDELIYLRKFAEKRKLLIKFKNIDSQVWREKFFIPKGELNMIDKPKKCYPLTLWFNDVIHAIIPQKNISFFYTPTSEEKIPRDLPAWVFSHEEYYNCPQYDRKFKKGREESLKLTKKIAEKTIFFADFEARNKVLEFISKYPYHYQQKPFRKETIKRH